MVHISPWAATEELFAKGAQLLHEGAALMLYGPFFEHDVETAEPNQGFDLSLCARDPRLPPQIS